MLYVFLCSRFLFVAMNQDRLVLLSPFSYLARVGNKNVNVVETNYGVGSQIYIYMYI